jgi:hypothetical protein
MLLAARWLSIAALAAFGLFAVIRPLLAGAYYVPRPHSTGYAYTWLVLALFAPYALLLWTIRRGPPMSPRAAVGAVALVTAPLLIAPLIQSQDLYQYLFYAKLQILHGANPYVVDPDTFARDPWLAYIAWREQLSVYGPLWSLAMQGVVALSRGSLVRAVLLAKTFAVALGAVTVWGLVTATRDRGQDDDRAVTFVVVAFALNPLVLSSVALSGHADIAVAAAFAWAVVADRRGRPGWSACLLAAATLVKAYAGIALVGYLALLWRRAGWRVAARSAIPPAALAACASLPYWRGAATFDGVLSIAGRTSSSLAGTAARIASSVLVELDVSRPAALALTVVRLAGAIVLALAFMRLVRRGATTQSPWPSVLALSSAYLIVTPWFLPWHALGVFALACAVPGSPLSAADTVFTGSCLATLGGPGLVGPIATAAARYGPPTIVYAARRRRQIGASA